jgi:mycofactocin precursor
MESQLEQSQSGTEATATAVVSSEQPDAGAQTVRVEEPVLEDLLVEEVSIDGMCGVY